MKNRLKSLGQRTSSNKDLIVHDVLSFFVQYKADFL